MKIGIIGLGIVGSAIRYGFEKLGHDTYWHDIAFDSSIEDILDTEICYICVPTPQGPNGKCDDSIVKEVFKNLLDKEYCGVIAIKSTVEPGTTQELYLLRQKSNRPYTVAFVPEFLRERCAIVDFTELHDVCIVGTHDYFAFEKVKESHGHFPKKFVKLTPTEAEFVKYFNNIHNATLIILANSFYEICKKMKVDYRKVKSAVVNRNHITDMYLDCTEEFRGFGGMCLPKDTKAMDALAKELNLNIEFFAMLLHENSKYKTTVLEGMRDEVSSFDG